MASSAHTLLRASTLEPCGWAGPPYTSDQSESDIFGGEIRIVRAAAVSAVGKRKMEDIKREPQ